MASRKALSAGRKLKSLLGLSIGGAATFGIFCVLKGDQKFYDCLVMPTVHRILDPESAHRCAVLTAKYRIFPKRNDQTPSLRTKLLGLEFDNCIGLAAGFDKDGEGVEGFFDWGFGFVEVGSVTPEPQPGNPKPRLFRLLEDRAVINRYGFNSEGHESVKLRLFEKDKSFSRILGVNLGMNKGCPEAANDYIQGVLQFGEKADYLVVNISSPNTPGLRALQSKEQLKQLLTEVIGARNKLKHKVPLLLKIAPDLLEQDKKDIADVILSEGCQVDGLIISNTTIARPPTVKNPSKEESGGLSGQPLLPLSTVIISDMYLLTKGRVPIIGVGGVSNGSDAYAKIRAGASLVQVLSTLVYRGPPVVETIKEELVQLLKNDRYKNVSEAVGADHKIDDLVSKLIRIR